MHITKKERKEIRLMNNVREFSIYGMVIKKNRKCN